MQTGKAIFCGLILTHFATGNKYKQEVNGKYYQKIGDQSDVEHFVSFEHNLNGTIKDEIPLHIEGKFTIVYFLKEKMFQSVRYKTEEIFSLYYDNGVKFKIGSMVYEGEIEINGSVYTFTGQDKNTARRMTFYWGERLN